MFLDLATTLGESEKIQREPSVMCTWRIRAFFQASKKTYGSPRILLDLHDAGERVGRRRVIRLMQQEGLCARIPRRFRITTNSEHKHRIAPNIVNRNFNPASPNQLWAADISYVRTWAGWMYLAVVIDLYSRRVVGWSTSDHMRTELPLAALEQAVSLRHSWPTESAATIAIEQYIHFYNAGRRHSTIGNRSPIEYELATATDDFKMAA